MKNELIQAAQNADWMQVVLNQGPPCFNLEKGKFCLRAHRWAGHSDTKTKFPHHKFVSFAELITALQQSEAELRKDKERLDWLDKYAWLDVLKIQEQVGSDCRKAIDAAMQSEEARGEYKHRQ